LSYVRDDTVKYIYKGEDMTKTEKDFKIEVEDLKNSITWSNKKEIRGKDKKKDKAFD